MKIDVSNIRHEPGAVLPISWEADATGFDNVNPQTRFEGRLLLNGRLLHIEHGTFRLDAHLTVPYHSLCDRCLTDVVDKLEVDINEQFVSERKPSSQEYITKMDAQTRRRVDVDSYNYDIDQDAVEDLEEDEYFTYRGHTLDLREAIEQLMTMAMPYQMLCRVNCKGLCANCGQNLNEGSCGCQDVAEGEILSPFADLKKLL